jgi:hypothetical protein
MMTGRELKKLRLNSGIPPQTVASRIGVPLFLYEGYENEEIQIPDYRASLIHYHLKLHPTKGGTKCTQS